MTLFDGKGMEEPADPVYTFKLECWNEDGVSNAQRDLVKIKVKAHSVEDAKKKARDLVTRQKFEVVEVTEVKN